MFTSQKTAIDNRKALVEAELELHKARKTASDLAPPAPQSSIEGKGFVLGASNPVPTQPRVSQIQDLGLGKNPPDGQPAGQPAGAKPPDGSQAPGPGGAIPKKD
jgi:hypothetical protein